MAESKKRIGIFSGTFDPVHRGHIEACVVALGVLELDKVLIMIEKQPRHKENVADFMDRANMIELATLDYPSLQMVDLASDNITTDKTLAYLSDRYPGYEYWYIVGSDTVEHISQWEGYETLLESVGLCVVLRQNDEQTLVERQIGALAQAHPRLKTKLLPSVWSPVSSSTVKQALQNAEVITGIDPAVQEYITKHHLYRDI